MAESDPSWIVALAERYLPQRMKLLLVWILVSVGLVLFLLWSASASVDFASGLLAHFKGRGNIETAQAGTPEPSARALPDNAQIVMDHVTVNGALPQDVLDHTQAMMGVRFKDQPKNPVTVKSQLITDSDLSGVKVQHLGGGVAANNTTTGDGTSTFEYEGTGSINIGNQIKNFKNVKIKSDHEYNEDNVIVAPSVNSTPVPAESSPRPQ